MEVGSEGRIVHLEAGEEVGPCQRVRGWTVPGVPNVHSHSFQRALAGLAEGPGPDSFWSWRKSMYSFLAQLTPGDVEAITAQLYLELLKAGFTCVGEFHYLHHAPGGRSYDDPAEMSRRILRAAQKTGIGLVHMPVVYEAGGFGGEPLEIGQQRFRMPLEGVARLHEALAEDVRGPYVRLGWALHSLRAVSKETFSHLDAFVPRCGPSVKAEGSPNGTLGGGAPPLHIHIAEQLREVQECVVRRGVRPVTWLLDHAPVNEDWCLVHATHAGEDELKNIVARGAVVGLCPATEANLGDGLFPLGTFTAKGGNFAIGTDSHVSRSPVEELRLLEYGQRLSARTRAVLRLGSRKSDRSDALAGAGGLLLTHSWRGGCRALGLNGGRIEVGTRADLVVLYSEHPAVLGR